MPRIIPVKRGDAVKTNELFTSLSHLSLGYYERSLPFIEPHTVTHSVCSNHNHTVTFQATNTAVPISVFKTEDIYSIDLQIGDLKWVFKIYPFGRNEQSKGYVSVYLCLKPCDDLFNNLSVPAEFSFKNQHEIYSKTFKPYDMWGSDKVCKNDVPLNFLFKIKVNENYMLTNCDVKCNAKPFYDLENFSDFMFEKPADFVFQGLDWKYSVHKEIISKRCPVFQAMFNNDSKEALSNEVMIPDVEGDTMKALLEYLYLGRVSNMDIVVDRLYAAANKYCLEKLEMLCEDYLISKLSTANVIDTLNLADIFINETLKSACLFFIRNNIKEVMVSDGWKTLESSPKISVTLVDYFCKLI